MENKTSIQVDISIRNKLEDIKRELNFKTINEVIKYLIKIRK